MRLRPEQHPGTRCLRNQSPRFTIQLSFGRTPQGRGESFQGWADSMRRVPSTPLALGYSPRPWIQQGRFNRGARRVCISSSRITTSPAEQQHLRLHLGPSGSICVGVGFHNAIVADRLIGHRAPRWCSEECRGYSRKCVGWEDLIDASLAALREQLEIDAVSTPELDEPARIAHQFSSDLSELNKN